MPPNTAFARDRDEIRLYDYSLNDEQVSIRESFARFFAENSKSERVRRSEPLGFDADLWTKLAELGVVSMRLPEDKGGVGGSLVDLTLIAEEAGRTAAPVTIPEAAAAILPISMAGDDGAKSRLEEVCSGQTVATVALSPLAAKRRQLVPAGAVAGVIIALDDDGLVLFEQDSRRPHVDNLGSAPLALWSPEDSSARYRIASGSEARKLYQRVVAEWRLLTAAALVGVAKQAITEAVEFAKTRITSHVPIGSLQGVSHPLADAEMVVSASRNLVWRAAWFLDNEPAERPELVPIAFAHTNRAAARATATALHMQGGFGFTLESDVTLYFRRAKGWSVVGDPNRAVSEVGAALATAAGFEIDATMEEDGYGLQPA